MAGLGHLRFSVDRIMAKVPRSAVSGVPLKRASFLRFAEARRPKNHPRPYPASTHGCFTPSSPLNNGVTVSNRVAWSSSVLRSAAIVNSSELSLRLRLRDLTSVLSYKSSGSMESVRNRRSIRALAHLQSFQSQNAVQRSPSSRQNTDSVSLVLDGVRVCSLHVWIPKLRARQGS